MVSHFPNLTTDQAREFIQTEVHSGAIAGVIFVPGWRTAARHSELDSCKFLVLPSAPSFKRLDRFNSAEATLRSKGVPLKVRFEAKATQPEFGGPVDSESINLLAGAFNAFASDPADVYTFDKELVPNGHSSLWQDARQLSIVFNPRTEDSDLFARANAVLAAIFRNPQIKTEVRFVLPLEFMLSSKLVDATRQGRQEYEPPRH